MLQAPRGSACRAARLGSRAGLGEFRDYAVKALRCIRASRERDKAERHAGGLRRETTFDRGENSLDRDRVHATGRARAAPAAAPRINRGTSPVQIQPHTRNAVVPNGNLGGAFRSATPAISPKNGTQTGIINRGQTPDAARNPIAGGNLNRNLGSTTLSGPASSALDNIRRRINDGGLPGMSASARAGTDRRLTAQHHEHHDGDSHGERSRTPWDRA